MKKIYLRLRFCFVSYIKLGSIFSSEKKSPSNSNLFERKKIVPFPILKSSSLNPIDKSTFE